MKASLQNYSQGNGPVSLRAYGSDPESSDKREALILKYAPLIKYIALRLAMRLPAYVSVEDLISAGSIGLMDALTKFDPGKGVQFSTYAEYRIKGSMLDELRALDWVPRSVRQKMSRLNKAYWELEKEKGRPVEDEEMAESLGVTLVDFYELLRDTNRVSLLDIENLPSQLTGLKNDELVQLLRDDEHRDPAVQLSLFEMKKILVQAIERLSQREKTILSLYYYEEMNLKEIGQIIGLTESRICQIHSKVVLKLRAQLKEVFDAER